ncbi:UPF0489 family protein [Bacillus paralicheniformis]|uniref:UPF0489 family protein n=1 Tax=Bacillus paralicheniformis TaxID=1648923 RepID=UPI002E234732|nr:UPF0489 family protein [Bacillus paralicheniformis]
MNIPRDYRVCFPEKNIFVSCDHNWAFAAWELKKRAGELTPDATLFHVDAHLDDVWDGLEVEGLYDIKNSKDIFNVSRKLKIDNFIWPAIGTGTINNVIYISQQSYGGDPFDFKDWDYTDVQLMPVKKILDSNKHNGFRYRTIEEFVENKDSLEVKRIIEGKNLILDLDLDYFNENENNLLQNNLMDEQKIIERLTILRGLYSWSLITVALSPVYCGGDENADYLLGLFYKVFNLDPDEAIEW